MKTIELVAAIIREDDKICTTSCSTEEFKNMWKFPGGRMELGETRGEALRRNIKEKLELDIEISSYLTTIDYKYSDFNLKMHCFICTICDENLRSNAYNDSKWVTLRELDKLNWIPADILVIEKLKEM